MDDYSAAITALNRSLELDPTHTFVWYDLAACLHDTGEYEGCERACRKTIETAKENVRATHWASLAELLHYHLGRLEEAEQAYKTAISLSKPEDHDGWPWLNYARLLESKEHPPVETEEYYSKAQKLFEIATTERPDYARGWSKLGWLYSRKTESKPNAEQAMRKAIELEPKEEGAWEALADFFLSENRPEEAEKVYLSALEANPGSEYLLFHLGKVLVQGRKIDEAQKAYEKFIERNPGAFNAQARLGELKLNNGKVDEGLDLLRRSVAIGQYKSHGWPALLVAEWMSNQLSLAELHRKTDEYLNQAARDPKVVSHIAHKLLSTKRTEVLPMAESLAFEALSKRNDSADIVMASFILSIREKWAEAIKLAPRLFDAARHRGNAIDAAIQLAIGSAASGYAREMLNVLKSSSGRISLEPLEVGLQEYLGESPVAPKEISDMAHDIAERIRARAQLGQASTAPVQLAISESATHEH